MQKEIHNEIKKEGKVDEIIKTLSEGAYGCIF